ncbi:hypothetical protein BAZSYMA_ACONTIG04950_1 [Bathymodiolus azoricus thioautotrophic gill symbiont]|uniref:Uncharacterized protein n=1 Tax=Bathymodiolus azoricus thioautotrophic gill symbiont TaxID=235205 RepID=A0A1H6MK66_9GAMM|nr:hypothetical protein BAZSYMA_ACONTIG04950_1 [Bathymodiolus azoricus thioautotrophic gill symbiont]
MKKCYFNQCKSLFLIQPSSEQVLNTQSLNKSFCSYKNKYNALYFPQLHNVLLSRRLH